MKTAIAAALLLLAAEGAQAQGFAQGFLNAQQQYLHNQLMQQQLEQMRQQPLMPQASWPTYHTYQFPGGRRLNCTTILEGTPAATTTCN